MVGAGDGDAGGDVPGRPCVVARRPSLPPIANDPDALDFLQKTRA